MVILPMNLISSANIDPIFSYSQKTSSNFTNYSNIFFSTSNEDQPEMALIMPRNLFRLIGSKELKSCLRLKSIVLCNLFQDQRGSILYQSCKKTIQERIAALFFVSHQGIFNVYFLKISVFAKYALSKDGSNDHEQSRLIEFIFSILRIKYSRLKQYVILILLVVLLFLQLYQDFCHYTISITGGTSVVNIFLVSFVLLTWSLTATGWA